METSTILSKKFRLPNTIRITDLNDLQLVIGGGTNEPHDVIRNAFALLINPDKLTLKIILKCCDMDCQYLATNLVNNSTIIKSVTYF